MTDMTQVSSLGIDPFLMSASIWSNAQVLRASVRLKSNLTVDESR